MLKKKINHATQGKKKANLKIWGRGWVAITSWTAPKAPSDTTDDKSWEN